MTIVPLLEIYLLFRMGDILGAGPTFALVIATGILGSLLLRRHGANLMMDIQQKMAQQQLPAEAMIRGVLTFMGGVLLLTPGIITDVVGLSFVIPGTQWIWKKVFSTWWERARASGQVGVYTHSGPSQGEEIFQRNSRQSGENVIEVSANKSETTHND